MMALEFFENIDDLMTACVVVVGEGQKENRAGELVNATKYRI